jgi:magnesium-protoporphyrin O-methyltransferase
MANVINDKAVVKNYFNSKGFDRWRRIYGDGEVNKVQKDIRLGHQQTIDTLLSWLEADQNLPGLTFCDAGCGVGSLSIPLAQAGAKVTASDISEKMVSEGQAKAQALVPNNPISFSVQDLESIEGQFHTVACIDVLIHYPDRDLDAMIGHLASRADHRLILSFAPKTLYLSALKKVGELFPGPSKTTRAYQHKEADVRTILIEKGFHIERAAMTSTSFYYSRMIEAVRD